MELHFCDYCYTAVIGWNSTRTKWHEYREIVAPHTGNTFWCCIPCYDAQKTTNQKRSVAQ